MRRYLPPFAALRAFEAAAKHQSFKLAAEEIYLSASAISHQIRSLEAFLGTELFTRDKNNVRLTKEGLFYYQEIKQSFDTIESASLELNPGEVSDKLVINLDQSILSCWLSRISRAFQLEHPEVELEYINSDNPPNFQTNFDIAIYFAKQPLSEENTTHLLADEIALVAAPQVAEKLPQSLTDDALNEQLFLHCSCYVDEWAQWFAAYGLNYPKGAKKVTINNRAVVLQSARNGEGLAIGRQPYINDFLLDESLVMPYSKRIKTGFHYYVMTSKQAKRKPATSLYLSWLFNERAKLLALN